MKRRAHALTHGHRLIASFRFILFVILVWCFLCITTSFAIHTEWIPNLHLALRERRATMDSRRISNWRLECEIMCWQLLWSKKIAIQGLAWTLHKCLCYLSAQLFKYLSTSTQVFLRDLISSVFQFRKTFIDRSTHCNAILRQLSWLNFSIVFFISCLAIDVSLHTESKKILLTREIQICLSLAKVGVEFDWQF